MNNPHFVPPLVVLFCLVSDILMIFFFFAFCMRYISFDVNKTDYSIFLKEPSFTGKF